MKVLDVYDTMMEEIQSIYRSRLQLQILLSLVEGNKTLADLREITGSTSQAIIPKIRILEASQYIEAVDYEYYLTPSGRVITTKIQDYVMAIAVIHRNRDFYA
jgi:predicted transcriptional regulator